MFTIYNKFVALIHERKQLCHLTLNNGGFYEGGPRVARTPVKCSAIAESLSDTGISLSSIFVLPQTLAASGSAVWSGNFLSNYRGDFCTVAFVGTMRGWRYKRGRYIGVK
jgi:hypothetical protein